MRYGRHFKSLEADILKAFLYELLLFLKNRYSYTQKGNEVLFTELKQYLQDIKCEN